VHLDARAIELPFERDIVFEIAKRLLDAGRRVRQHRLHGPEDLNSETSEARLSFDEHGTCDGRQLACATAALVTTSS
jgi:hypothetical protein